MDECRRRSTGLRRSGVAGIQNEHACTASADGHIRSAIGSAGDSDQRLVARWGRRIGDLRRDGAVVFDETNADGAARDLDAARRAGAGQRDYRRLAVLGETVGNGDRGIAPGVGVLTLGQGLDECLTGLVDGLPVGIVAGLLDGLFQRLVEAIGFDRYSVVVVGCVAATDGIVRHCAASTLRHRLRLPCIRVRYRR